VSTSCRIDAEPAWIEVAGVDGALGPSVVSASSK
jgi:hypothetical protein